MKLQSFPLNPASQTQVPLPLQVPCWEQSFGQSLKLQSRWAKPLSHVQTPAGEHFPWLEHMFGQVFMAQFRPRKPSAHWQTPSTHFPRPEQSSGQALTEQSAPMNGFSQTHLKFAQVPWPEQSFGQIIVWQATPANMQSEYMEGWLFSAGLEMGDSLSSALGVNKSLVMNLRDVIYTSRAVVPLLAKAGKRGISIGSNGCNHPAQVPKLHRWTDHVSGESLVVMYHAFGYGGYGKSLCDGPGRCGDCAEAPNGVALCTEFRIDNSGPPASAEEVLKSIEAVRAEYPDAIVQSSTFDDFVVDVQNVSHLLPEVEGEVGDTW